MVLRFAGEEVARVPIAAVSEASPVYERPWLESAPALPVAARDVPPPIDDPSRAQTTARQPRSVSQALDRTSSTTTR